MWLRIGWLNRRDRQRFRLRHRRRIGFDADELDALRAGARTVDAPSPATGRPLSTAAENRIVSEIRGADYGGEDKKKDHCVHQQRRNDPFPIPILPTR